MDYITSKEDVLKRIGDLANESQQLRIKLRALAAERKRLRTRYRSKSNTVRQRPRLETHEDLKNYVLERKRKRREYYLRAKKAKQNAMKP